MNTNEIINKLNLIPDKDEIIFLKKELEELIFDIKNAIKNKKVKADIFIGGSYAKKTLVRKKEYEVDIFVRFFRSEDINRLFDRVVSLLKNKERNISKLKGSREYYQVMQKNFVFEIIPVLKVKNPKEAENITDLSYSHVNYMKKKLNQNLIKEILITKKFFDARGVYGAESYISGFSGYAIECLMLHYKKLDNMLKDFIKNDKIIIDIEKKYKNKNEIMLLMNESKTKSPIILVDPTWKERNVLAALSSESYEKLKNDAKKYLKKKSISYFQKEELSKEKIISFAKEKKIDFVHVELYTQKQEGDIAGTKMKKFSRFLFNEIQNYFKIDSNSFSYSGKDRSDIYITAKPIKEIIRKGPPISMKKEVILFKKENKNTFIDKDRIFARRKNNYSLKQFLDEFVKKYNKKISEMDISNIKITN